MARMTARWTGLRAKLKRPIQLNQTGVTPPLTPALRPGRVSGPEAHFLSFPHHWQRALLECTVQFVLAVSSPLFSPPASLVHCPAARRSSLGCFYCDYARHHGRGDGRAEHSPLASMFAAGSRHSDILDPQDAAAFAEAGEDKGSSSCRGRQGNPLRYLPVCPAPTATAPSLLVAQSSCCPHSGTHTHNIVLLQTWSAGMGLAVCRTQMGTTSAPRLTRCRWSTSSTARGACPRCCCPRCQNHWGSQ